MHSLIVFLLDCYYRVDVLRISSELGSYQGPGRVAGRVARPLPDVNEGACAREVGFAGVVSGVLYTLTAPTAFDGAAVSAELDAPLC